MADVRIIDETDEKDSTMTVEELKEKIRQENIKKLVSKKANTCNAVAFNYNKGYYDYFTCNYDFVNGDLKRSTLGGKYDSAYYFFGSKLFVL